jgi:Ni/Co efflux regulator RcnB
MQKLMISAAMALLILPALAQEHHGGGPGGGHPGGGGGAAPAAAPAAPAAPARPAYTNRAEFGRASAAGHGTPVAPQAQARPQGGNNGNWQGNRPGFNAGNNNRPGGNPGFNPGNNNRPGFANGIRPAPGGFNRPGGSRQNYSGFSRYHQSFNAPRRFHAGGYNRPSGWYYRRWNYGDILPALFWGQQYWLNDYSGYDLPPPPPGTVWVRNGNDALLIDRDSGEIVTVEYDVFY